MISIPLFLRRVLRHVPHFIIPVSGLVVAYILVVSLDHVAETAKVLDEQEVSYCSGYMSALGSMGDSGLKASINVGDLVNLKTALQGFESRHSVAPATGNLCDNPLSYGKALQYIDEMMATGKNGATVVTSKRRKGKY